METNNVFFLNHHQSEQLDQLFTALSKAQGEFDTANQSSRNTHFSSDYASLTDMIKASRPALVKYGLSVDQDVITHEGIDYLVTKLGHSSGQWKRSCVALRPARDDQQAFGGAVTYKKRYCYGTVIGLGFGYEDDDGEDDRKYHESKPQPNYQHNKTSAATHKQKTVAPQDVITQEQYSMLAREIGEYTWIADDIKATYGLGSLKELPKEFFEICFDQARNNRNATKR